MFLQTAAFIESVKLRCLSKNKKDIPLIFGCKNDEEKVLLRTRLSIDADDGPPYPIYY